VAGSSVGPVNLRLFGETVLTLFVIMDPPGTLPIFLALTARLTDRRRIRAARQAVGVALLVIVGFAIFGQALLAYLRVSLPALQCAGGLLLLLIALELLTGRGDEPTRTEGVNIAFVPLGTPLLAGPGAIVATMVFVNRSHDWADRLAIGLGIVAVHAVLYLTMRFAGTLHRLLRDSGVTLVSRIAGLLLSAIAVQLVADAVRAFAAGQG
jgi:multiple antibiotic resistance protein